MMKTSRPNRGYLETIVTCRCPRCREGKLFKYPLGFRLRRNMEMFDSCPVCNQPTDLEVGFYYGTGYISYLLALVLTGISCLLWALFIGFSFHDNRFAVWITLNSVGLLLSQLWLMRFSRALWLSFFVGYDEDWEHTKPLAPERINEEQKHNW